MSGPDRNVCEHCNLLHDLDVRACPRCQQSLVLDARGAISVWRRGDIEDGTLGPMLEGLRKRFRRPVVLQPGFVEEAPSDRSDEGWNGISANVLLRQVAARQEVTPGAWLTLGVTEETIVSCAAENFLFGLAYLDGAAAILSLAPLREDEPDDDLLAERVLKIALHEIGHALGRDDEPYEDGNDCVMLGDVELDDLESLDEGSGDYCPECRGAIFGA